MRRTASRLGVPVLLILATTGCSFVFVNGPPRGHEEMAEFTCTENRAMPFIDAIWAGLFVAAGLGALLDPEQEGWGEPTSEQLAAASFVIGVPFGVSAIVGNRRVNECLDAKRALQERLGGALESGGQNRRTPVRWPVR
jgi:hypothetical protein